MKKMYLIGSIEKGVYQTRGIVEAENGKDIAEKLGLSYGWSGKGKSGEYHQLYLIQEDTDKICIIADELPILDSPMKFEAQNSVKQS